jgi:hypothetical protein
MHDLTVGFSMICQDTLQGNVVGTDRAARNTEELLLHSVSNVAMSCLLLTEVLNLFFAMRQS